MINISKKNVSFLKAIYAEVNKRFNVNLNELSVTIDLILSNKEFQIFGPIYTMEF